MTIRFGSFLLLTLGACGAETGADIDQPLPAGHVRGTMELDTRTSALVAPVPPDPSEIRVGLAWYADPAGDPTARPWVLQEVPIVSHSDAWPMEFELAITEPPPEGAVHYPLGYSQAKFVAYRDNGNGELDWTPIGADAFIDSVVAYHPHQYLWFFDDGGLKLMMPGESELSPPETPITLLERSDERSSCHLLEWTPRFSFEASRRSYSDPDEGDQGPWDTQGFPLCPADVLPPAGATVACEPTGGPSRYQYYTSWPATDASAFVSETCGGLIRTCEGRRADPEAAGPWPCPCDPNVYRCVDYQLNI